MNFSGQTSHTTHELTIPYLEWVNKALCGEWIDTFYKKLERSSVLKFQNLHSIWVSFIEPKFRQFFEEQAEIKRAMRGNLRTHPDIVCKYQSDLEAVELIYVNLRDFLYTIIRQHYTWTNKILALVPDFVTRSLFMRARQNKKIIIKSS